MDIYDCHYFPFLITNWYTRTPAFNMDGKCCDMWSTSVVATVTLSERDFWQTIKMNIKVHNGHLDFSNALQNSQMALLSAAILFTKMTTRHVPKPSRTTQKLGKCEIFVFNLFNIYTVYYQLQSFEHVEVLLCRQNRILHKRLENWTPWFMSIA